MWAKSLVVRGLVNSTTIDDLLRFLDGQNCSFLATGDAVWQSVQRNRPVRIEGEISCSMKETKTSSKTAFRSLDELRAEPLVLYEWGSTLGLPASRWGYTVTTMAIHDNNAGQVYLVDMTARGYTDTCGKSLSAAVDDTQWKGWADEDVAKVYQFYQLRAQGFGVANHELQNYVNKIIESRHSKKAGLSESVRISTLLSMDYAAQTFYCESILNGVISWAGEDLTTACHLVFPGPSDRKRIAEAREIMETEMGTQCHSSDIAEPLCEYD
ncbi:hypothetical protein ANCDUO_10061 [Ancylostoma duodenale]|uniref:Uncharacterized protein n=1 Tax=Ancylostoma duodenale TaxID=51022 RepID=A0A0C2CS80_9BILA|nr:hypothetical protein ANCDUO_10061 [Ancylostoma duodenale]